MLSPASPATRVRWRTSARVSGIRLYFGCLRPRKVSKDMNVLPSDNLGFEVVKFHNRTPPRDNSSCVVAGFTNH